MNMKSIRLFTRGMFVFLLTQAMIWGIQEGAFSQAKYWVSLTDKNGVEFDPYDYFSEQALQRRVRNHLPVNDPTDWPLNQKYIQEIQRLVAETGLQSRWLNGLVVRATPDQIAGILELPFVREVESMDEWNVQVSGLENNVPAEWKEEQRKLAWDQLARMGGNHFWEKGLDGTGIRIAVFDIGFKEADTNPAFAHLRKKQSILKTWDFVDNDEDVYHYNSHGTMVLSCIAGMIDSVRIGLATGSTFLLARTEKNSEKFAEEENWLAAAEWADKNGADIINSSLGYTHHRYFNDQMDGKTSLVARAAKMAFQKGMLVVNAAGNEGSGNWYYVGTPADVDSVLSVGGISPTENYHIGFSSFGPTSDGRMKPNVCAYGHALTARGDFLTEADGTSFASPLVAGFAACAWQAKPGLTNGEIFRAIEQSADLYPYFDYAHGYGVPQARYFTAGPVELNQGLIDLRLEENYLIVTVDQEREVEGNFDKNLLFYNLQTPENVLLEYAVVKVTRPGVLRFDLRTLSPGTRLNVWFRGAHTVFEFEE
jgi:subtilisin family serine protease